MEWKLRIHPEGEPANALASPQTTNGHHWLLKLTRAASSSRACKLPSRLHFKRTYCIQNTMELQTFPNFSICHKLFAAECGLRQSMDGNLSKCHRYWVKIYCLHISTDFQRRIKNRKVWSWSYNQFNLKHRLRATRGQVHARITCPKSDSRSSEPLNARSCM